MNKVRLVILEDEFVIAEDIRSTLTENGYEVVEVFDKGEEAEPFVLKNPPDLLLVDIRLAGKMTGIQLVENVKGHFSLPVIYITANSETDTYLKAKATKPNAFLIKPFTPSNLLTAIDLALFNFSNEIVPVKIEKPVSKRDSYDALIHQCLFIRSNGRHKKICPEDILFVEAAGSYVHIQTVDERFMLTQNLSNFLRRNPIKNIVRVHRSYLVNLTRVDAFEDSFIFVQTHKIPLSDGYKEEFMSRIHCL